MRSLGQIFIYSAIATAVIYILYRSRRKQRKKAILDTKQRCGESFSSLPNSLQFIAEKTQYDNFENYLEYLQNVVPSFAKVSLCANICLLPSEDFPSVEKSTQITAPSETSSIGEMSILGTINNVESAVDIEVCGGDSISSGSDHALTPDSTVSLSSPELPSRINVPPGCFNDPTNDIYEDNPEEMNGTMLPKVLIPSDMWAEGVDHDIWHETFYVPAHMGGVLIGRLGKNVRELKNVWQAEFCLNTCPGRQDTLIFKLSCPLKHKDDVLQWVSRRFRMRPSRTPIGNPNQLRRYLPLGEPVPVHVRSLYATKEFFVTIRDEEYSKYMKMQLELDKDYAGVNNFRMQLCEPVTSGTVAVVPHSQGFARALIISVYSTWPKSVFYFLLDHGTFGVVALNKLRKIRAKYMRTPFQAIHVSWAHAFPVFSDVPDIHILRTFFTSGRIHAFGVRMETCCRTAVAFGETYPPPYSNNGLLDVLVTACNSGLYMAVPLAVYPSRQSWLNKSNVPYYPFNYSAIDYPALVSFVAEEASTVPEVTQSDEQGHLMFPKVDTTSLSNNLSQSNKQINRNRNRGGGPSVRRPFIWNQRPLGQSRGCKSSMTSQKENQSGFDDRNHKVESKAMHHNSISEPVANFELKRRPLGVRNVRGSSNSGFRGSARGRGYYSQSRHE